jgi:glucuronoarabinoxylan endo-1,4-beta-xylanase
MPFAYRYLIRFFPLIVLSLSVLPHAAEIEVEATRGFQTIDGFGASSAWIDSKITADLATQFWQDDTLNGHIGLSILRTRIDQSGYTSAEANPMKKAIQVNPDMIVWSTSWLPPQQFQTDGYFNSDSASMQGYADFLVKYVKDVKTNAGIDLYAVSCQNEPDADVTGSGCNWTGTQLKVFVRDYWGPACEKAGITARRMIGESVRSDFTVSNPSLTDTAAAGYVDIVGTHLYYGGPYPYPLADSLRKPYWMTEICGLEAPDTTIANGIKWANQVHDCLVKCKMNAYHYWWLVNGNTTDDEGLCNSKGQPTPRMYALGNFSKFIRPGFVRVAATDSPATGVKASAYYGSSSKRLVLVAINSGIDTAINITIPEIPEGKTATPWLTDSTHRLERQEPVALSNGAFTYTLPARSVVTFVLPDVAITVGLKTGPSRPSITISRFGGNRIVEVPSAEKPWTVRIVSLSGRELMQKRVPRGCRSVVIEDLRHSGIVLVRTLQDGIVRTSTLLLSR